MSSAHGSTASATHANGCSKNTPLPAMNDPNAKTKHLSQPYNMHSISTESLPALFGAASLRRTNSNVVSKTRASRGTSPAPHSSSLCTPPSPTASHTAPHRTTPPAQSTASAAGAAATTARRPPIHAIPEQFELDSSHRRRPSSWDIMDMLAIEQLRQWMVCFCVVNFDLEKGQGKFSVLIHSLVLSPQGHTIESVYPPSDFTPEESKNICFSSFPDSNTFDVGDTVFNFRIRSTTAGRAATGPTTDAGFLYGYVFFRQKQDPSIRRGYFQKSVVILSQHPFIGLFSKMVSVLGPAYFEVGKPMLETAFHNIASWRAPATDSLMELPFMGTLYQVQLARPHQPQLLETAPFEIATFQPDTHILSSVPMNGGLYKHFQDLVPDLWLCWELMTLAEPIMLIGTCPEVCSESVASLVDLINPIPYCGDYRPYFTIHDADFKSFCNKSSPPSSIVLGVTNPFFVKTLEHWPHIIKIGKPVNRRPNSKLMHDGTIGKAFNGSPRHGKPSSLEFVQGLVSKRKSVIAKDTNLLLMLAEATANRSSPGYLLDNILRKHFSTLTEKFLVPLNRYFATLVPSDISLSSTAQFPHIAPFKQQTFLKFLAKNPPAISFRTSTFKSSSETCQSFYKDFLKCGNFATWLRLRTIAAQNELRRRYLEILSLGDVVGWVKGRNEVELVDLLVRMREELGSSANNGDLFGFKPKPRTRPGLSREGSYNSSDEYGGLLPGIAAEDHRRYTNSDHGSGSASARSDSGSDAESRTTTPPPDLARDSRAKPSPLGLVQAGGRSHHGTPSGNGIHGSVGPKAIPPLQRTPDNRGQFSNASSFSSSSSRTATPSRSSSSSSLNLGWSEEREREREKEQEKEQEKEKERQPRGSRDQRDSRESSPERQRRRFAPEASIIKATSKQKEQLRDQIRLLIAALPVDLRYSLQANEAKKQAVLTMSFEGH
ncbi:Protein dennd6a [Mortierella alpina]|uniref:Protein dennd6a n=1 Tax=Mortierella alpina TaxID=64518 RepID=A0A9P6J8V9_MORAP|nr:Protein dennd6a [Mortierella alpina]